MPIASDHVEQLQYSRDCSCITNCDLCSVQYTLNVKATRKMNVTSHHLISTNQLFLPVHGLTEQDSESGILLCKLNPGQELQITCTARKGIAKDHAKWSPCAAVYAALFLRMLTLQAALNTIHTTS